MFPIPDLVLKNLFSLIYIHKPKSYELFCNILEDFNFGDLLKLDIFNQFMEYFFSFWLFNGYEMILNCNLVSEKSISRKKNLAAKIKYCQFGKNESRNGQENFCHYFSYYGFGIPIIF